MFATQFARFAIFVVYFWFGILKVVGESPATALIEQLYNRTMPIMPFATFLILFGIFEMALGLLVLFSRATKVTTVFIAIHLIMTAGPLVLLPAATWSGAFVPTLEGQYIIKNILIVSVLLYLFPSRKVGGGR
ncbi:MAG: hypothetical protein AAB865_00335 [Patescibacteria group bacterium]